MSKKLKLNKLTIATMAFPRGDKILGKMSEGAAPTQYDNTCIAICPTIPSG